MPAPRTRSTIPAGRATLALAVASVLGLAVAACAQAIGETKVPRLTEGELLIQFHDALQPGSEEAARAELGHRVLRRFTGTRWQHVRLKKGTSVDEAMRRYRNHPAIIAAEPNWLVRVLPPGPEPSGAVASASFAASSEAPAAAVANAEPATEAGFPDDPLFPSQWALRTIRAPEAWLRTTGSAEVVVAVIDTGVNYRHEDLAGNIWTNAGEIAGNGIDDDANGWVDDLHGIDTANDPSGNDSDPMDRGYNGGYYHGTMVAGIIGAVGRNGRGIAGANWAVRILPIRAIRASGEITTADELEALAYLLAMKQRGLNLRAVNMSYGGMPYSTAERDALAALDAAGVLLCVSAGNSGANTDSTPTYPACHAMPGMIAVAATDSADRLASFPAGGSSSYGRTSVDLAAPGVGIVCTTASSNTAYYAAFDGTSAAAPHVTGAVALLAAARPDVAPQTLKSALMESVDRNVNLTNRMVSHGRLNVLKALNHPSIATGPPIVAWVPSHQTVVQGKQAVFQPVIFGAQPRAIQWFREGQLMTGATNETLVLVAVTASQSGHYQVAVTNAVGLVLSSAMSLDVLVPPVITQAPISQSVAAGDSVTLSVSFSGNPARSGVQWLQGTTPRASNTVDGADAFLVLTNLQSAQAGTWRVRVRNAATAPGTSGAERTFALKVLVDADHDGLPDAWETTHGLRPDLASDALLDADVDGLSNRAEYLAGTNPTNAASRLQWQRIDRLPPEAIVMEFQAISNRTYTLQSRESTLAGDWRRMADFPATSTNRIVRWTEWFAPSSGPSQQFRVVTPRVP